MPLSVHTTCPSLPVPTSILVPVKSEGGPVLPAPAGRLDMFGRKAVWSRGCGVLRQPEASMCKAKANSSIGFQFWA